MTGSSQTLNGSCNNETSWRGVYIPGALFSIIVLIGFIVDIVIGTITNGDLSAIPRNAVDMFAQFQANPLLGLYNMDCLNLVIQACFIPVYYALYAAHRNTEHAIALFALILFLVGTTVFIVNNSALQMLDCAGKYAVASTEAHKLSLAAAGEALLAKGSHGSYNAFIGFVLPTCAGLIMSVAMLRGGVFGRLTSWLGIAGGVLMVLYLVLVTFVPAVKTMATAFAMPGGILLLAWMIMFTVKLFKLARD
jgi:hypothetical protein